MPDPMPKVYLVVAVENENAPAHLHSENDIGAAQNHYYYTEDERALERHNRKTGDEEYLKIVEQDRIHKGSE